MTLWQLLVVATNTTIEVKTVIPSANAGRFMSAAVVSGMPAIAIWSETANQVRNDARTKCYRPPPRSRSDTVLYTSRACQILYSRAMDARGSLWPAVPIVVDANAATLKSFLSLAAVNGRPAVAYTARTPSLSLQQLMFKMASDASGTSFATAAAVVVVPAVNVQCSTRRWRS